MALLPTDLFLLNLAYFHLGMILIYLYNTLGLAVISGRFTVGFHQWPFID